MPALAASPLTLYNSFVDSLRLIELIKSDAAPHALLLCGAEGCGQNALAHCLAAAYLGTDENALAASPYFYECADTAVDAVRTAAANLNRRVYGAGRHALLLPNAHLLSVMAQNILLKTIEEPPPDTLIILTGHEPGLLSTIRSRCAVMRIGAMPRDNVRKMLVAAGVPADRASVCAALSGGAFESAVALADDGYWGFRENALPLCKKLLLCQPVLGDLHAFLTENLPAVGDVQKPKSGKKKDEVQAASLAAFMQILLSLLWDITAVKLSAPVSNSDCADFLRKTAPRFTNAALQGIMRAVFDAQKFLRDGASPPLLLDWLWAGVKLYVV